MTTKPSVSTFDSLYSTGANGFYKVVLTESNLTQDILCIECNEICRDACSITCSQNNHKLMICRQCLKSNLLCSEKKKKITECIIDGSNCKFSADFIARQKINELLVYCPMHIQILRKASNIMPNIKQLSFCSWTGKLIDLSDHMLNNCKSCLSLNFPSKNKDDISQEFVSNVNDNDLKSESDTYQTSKDSIAIETPPLFPLPAEEPMVNKQANAGEIYELDRSLYDKNALPDDIKQDIIPSNIDLLANYAHLCLNVHVERQLEGVRRIRRLLSKEENPHIQEVVDSGIVPRLIAFLKCPENADFNRRRLQFEAAFAVTNIASGTSAHTTVIVQHGGISALIQALNSNDIEVQEQCIWALGNITGDCTQYRNMVLDFGILQHLASLINLANVKINESFINNSAVKNISLYQTLMSNLVWTLANCCRGKPTPRLDYVLTCMQMIDQLLMKSERLPNTALQDGIWAVAYVADAVFDLGFPMNHSQNQKC